VEIQEVQLTSPQRFISLSQIQGPVVAAALAEDSRPCVTGPVVIRVVGPTIAMVQDWPAARHCLEPHPTTAARCSVPLKWWQAPTDDPHELLQLVYGMAEQVVR
jgi:hypothetical protein